MRLIVSNVNMVLVGDTFVGRPDPDSAFATARPLLKDADIAFCNLETVVADAKYLAPHDHDHHPRTDEWMFDSYVRAGFNVMNLANNPSTWHGLDPFLRCLDVLDKAGIVRGGGGRNLAEARKPAVIERNGTKVAFVCRPDHGASHRRQGRYCLLSRPDFLRAPASGSPCARLSTHHPHGS
jgi:poly-gamma-glutamate synthesis protein (capsule biosynthesis protein)